MTTERETFDATDETEPACKSAPPVDARHDSPEFSDPADSVSYKRWTYADTLHVGDCYMDQIVITLRSNGIATYSAAVSGDDDDDAWVIYGGISLYDQNNAMLWTSPKLVGPSLGGATRWIQDFGFPVQWYDPAVSISINRAHC